MCSYLQFKRVEEVFFSKEGVYSFTIIKEANKC